MKRIISQAALGLLLLSLLVFSGCGNDMGSVQGRVTIDGEPAPAGLSIQFQPQGENASPSYGSTDESGYYVMYFSTQKKGVMPGKNIVSISLSMAEDPETGALVIPESLRGIQIPPEYSSKSTLEFEVTGGSNTFDIDIKTR